MLLTYVNVRTEGSFVWLHGGFVVIFSSPDLVPDVCGPWEPASGCSEYLDTINMCLACIWTSEMSSYVPGSGEKYQ